MNYELGVTSLIRRVKEKNFLGRSRCAVRFRDLVFGKRFLESLLHFLITFSISFRAEDALWISNFGLKFW